MAKYEAQFSCGHKCEVSLFGSYAERERKLAWYAAAGLCPQCYRAKAPKGYVELEMHGADDWTLRGDRCYEIREEFKSRGFKFEGRSKKWIWRGSAAEALAKLDELLAVGAAVDKCCREMEPVLRAKAV